MSFWFYVAIFFAILGILGLLIGKVNNPDNPNRPFSFRPLGALFIVIALLFTALSSFTVVGSRNVGVEKFFNATTGRTLPPGPHFKAPWHNVTDIDGTIQPEEYTTGNPIWVKIGDQGEAKVALSYRWRINPAGADEIYKDYRNAEDITEAVRKALVTTNIKAALNEELGTYNPLENVQIDASMTPSQIAKVTIPPIPFAQLNAAVKKNLETKIADLGGLIQVQSVTISYLQLPKSTQDKINEFNAKVQDSKNALIDIAIKSAQATANEKLAKSVDNSPNVLVSKCIDGLVEGSIQNQPGFSCWGAGSAVVIPGR